MQVNNSPQKQLRIEANNIRAQAKLLRLKMERFIAEAERLEKLAANKSLDQNVLIRAAEQAKNSNLNWIAFPSFY